MSARRYLVVIQDERGYAPPTEHLEPAPPDGPVGPVIHAAVLEADFKRVVAENTRLREALEQIASGLDDGKNPALSIVYRKARKALALNQGET